MYLHFLPFFDIEMKFVVKRFSLGRNLSTIYGSGATHTHGIERSRCRYYVIDYPGKLITHGLTDVACYIGLTVIVIENMVCFCNITTAWINIFSQFILLICHVYDKYPI